MVCLSPTLSREMARWQIGRMVASTVTNTCKETLAPSFFGSGRIFFIHSCYYKFDTLTEYDWPVRDACGKGELDQLNGVAEPRGNIFIHLLMNINCSPMCNFSCQWWTRSLNKLTKDFAFSQSQIFFNEVENPWASKRQLLESLQWPIYASNQLTW